MADYGNYTYNAGTGDSTYKPTTPYAAGIMKNLQATNNPQAYQNEAALYTTNMTNKMRPEWERGSRNIDEQANRTGMTGSRAYVDLKSLYAQNVANQQQDIANQGELLKYDLYNKQMAAQLPYLKEGADADRADTELANKYDVSLKDIMAKERGQAATYDIERQKLLKGIEDIQLEREKAYLNAIVNDPSARLYYMAGTQASGDPNRILQMNLESMRPSMAAPTSSNPYSNLQSVYSGITSPYTLR